MYTGESSRYASNPPPSRRDTVKSSFFAISTNGSCSTVESVFKVTEK